MSEIIKIKSTENLSLIDAIQMRSKAQVILKARGRMGLPHKLVQVGQDCLCTDDAGNTTTLKCGDYLAVYRVGIMGKATFDFRVVRLTEFELQKIDAILMRRFGSSLAKEKASNILPNVCDLPCFSVSKSVVNGLSLKADELYSSDGLSSTRLCSILRLKEDAGFFVLDTTNPKKKHMYNARKGDIFCVLATSKDEFVRLVLTAKEDVPAIKMQEKKEKILRQKSVKKITTKKVLRAFRRRKIEKIRN